MCCNNKDLALMKEKETRELELTDSNLTNDINETNETLETKYFEIKKSEIEADECDRENQYFSSLNKVPQLDAIKAFRVGRVSQTEEGIKKLDGKYNNILKTLDEIIKEHSLWEKTYSYENYNIKLQEKRNAVIAISINDTIISSLKEKESKLMKEVSEHQEIWKILNLNSSSQPQSTIKQYNYEIGCLRKQINDLIESNKKHKLIIKDADIIITEIDTRSKKKEIEGRLQKCDDEKYAEHTRLHSVEEANKKEKLLERQKVAMHRLDIINNMIKNVHQEEERNYWRPKYLAYAKKHKVCYDESIPLDLFRKCNSHRSISLRDGLKVKIPGTECYITLKNTKKSFYIEYSNKCNNQSFDVVSHAYCKKYTDVLWHSINIPDDLTLYNIKSKKTVGICGFKLYSDSSYEEYVNFLLN